MSKLEPGITSQLLTLCSNDPEKQDVDDAHLIKSWVFLLLIDATPTLEAVFDEN